MELQQLGKRIKDERRRQGLTLEALAERVGISRNFLWEIEAGRKAPALNTLYNLSITLNASIDYLMGVVDDNRRINDDPSGRTEHDIQISRLLKQLYSCGERELRFVSNMLTDFSKYVEGQ